MTPKEKAKELFCKMYGSESKENINDIYVLNPDGYFIAKDNALIAVDEIINHLVEIVRQEYGHDQVDIGQDYYEEVKQEIEKL